MEYDRAVELGKPRLVFFIVHPATLPLVQSRTQMLHYALRGLHPALRLALETIVAFRMPAATKRSRRCGCAQSL